MNDNDRYITREYDTDLIQVTRETISADGVLF